ncbi:MAG: hypothetical protein ACP5TV_00380, partial [Anaerolineae bacterium]
SGVVASLALSVALTVMVGSFRQSMTAWLDAVLPADVYVRADAARTLRAVAGAIEARTSADDPIFDTSGAFFYFLTGRHNPTRHDYFWPSFLTDEEVKQLVRDLESRRPALVISRQTEEPVFGWASFAQSYPEVAAYIEAHYQPDIQIGEYMLWSRK